MGYVYKSAQDLPDFLNALHIAGFLGISKTRTYALLNAPGFPTIQIGKRKIVQKQKLLEWLDENAGNNKNCLL